MTDIDIQAPGRGPGNSPWRDEKVCKRVHALWANHSASQISDKIWTEFQIVVSRNSVVGYLHRQKLTVEQKSEVHPATRSNGVHRPRRMASTSVNVQRINAAKAAPRIKPEPFVMACAEVEPLNISLMDLKDGKCRYPFGDDAATMTFCGHPTAGGSSYCAPHHLHCSAGVPQRRGGVSPLEFGKAKGGVFGRVA